MTNLCTRVSQWVGVATIAFLFSLLAATDAENFKTTLLGRTADISSITRQEEVRTSVIRDWNPLHSSPCFLSGPEPFSTLHHQHHRATNSYDYSKKYTHGAGIAGGVKGFKGEIQGKMMKASSFATKMSIFSEMKFHVRSSSEFKHSDNQCDALLDPLVWDQALVSMVAYLRDTFNQSTTNTTGPASDGLMAMQSIIGTFGTHFVRKIYEGGLVEIFASETFNAEMEAKGVEAAVKATYTSLTNNVTLDAGAGINTLFKNSTTDRQIVVRLTGGSPALQYQLAEAMYQAASCVQSGDCAGIVPPGDVYKMWMQSADSNHTSYVHPQYDSMAKVVVAVALALGETQELADAMGVFADNAIVSYLHSSWKVDCPPGAWSFETNQCLIGYTLAQTEVLYQFHVAAQVDTHCLAYDYASQSLYLDSCTVSTGTSEAVLKRNTGWQITQGVNGANCLMLAALPPAASNTAIMQVTAIQLDVTSTGTRFLVNNDQCQYGMGSFNFSIVAVDPTDLIDPSGYLAFGEADDPMWLFEAHDQKIYAARNVPTSDRLQVSATPVVHTYNPYASNEVGLRSRLRFM